MITIHAYPKAILHADCDAFFTSVEQSLNASLKGKPVVTGRERGIASAVSYEAKKMGIRRGMRLFEIKKICPDCVILPSDYETYSLVSRRFYEIIRRFTPDVEEYSIDEVFADITGLRKVHRCSYEEIALKIQQTVHKELGLTISIGLSITKSLAKICSKEQKPAGLTCLPGHDLHRFLKHIPVARVCGFGPSSVAILQKNSIQTVLDFIQKPKWLADRLLGKIGDELWHELRGECVYSINQGPTQKPASINKAKTFTPASDDKDFVRAQLFRNAESAFIKLRRHHLAVKRISAHLRDNEFHSTGMDIVLNYPTVSLSEASEVLSKLFEAIYSGDRKYRQTGICLTELSEARHGQQDLFLDPLHIQTMQKIAECTDQVNKEYGKHTLHLGSSHALQNFQQHLGIRGDIHPRKLDRLKGETDRRRVNIPLWNVNV